MKRFLSVAVSLSLLLTMTGCAGKEGAKSGDSAQSKLSDTDKYNVDDMTFEDVTIRVATKMGGGAEDANSAYYESMVKKFNEMDNGITVEMTNITTEQDYIDKLSTDFAAGDAPNVFYDFGGSRDLDYVAAGAILDLEPYLEADPQWRDRFLDYWEPGTYSSYGYDGIYAVPWSCYQVVLYYNKEILEANKLEVPTTFDELMDACETLKSNGIAPFQVGEKSDFRFGHLHTDLSLKKYGPDVAEQLAKREMAYDSKEQIEIYSMIKEMVDKGYLGDNLLNMDMDQEDAKFKAGEAAFHYDGSWFAGTAADSDIFKEGKMGVARFPAITQEYANVDMGGAADAFFISTLGATDEEIAASVVFLKYLTSEEYVDGLLEANANTMAIKSNYEVDNYLLNDINTILSETEACKSDLQNYDTASHMITTVRAALQGLAMGNSPEEVGKQIVDTIAEYE